MSDAGRGDPNGGRGRGRGQIMYARGGNQTRPLGGTHRAYMLMYKRDIITERAVLLSRFASR